MNFPRPFPHGVGFLPEIGFENDKRHIKLDPVFENILQEKNKGVIIISFGTLTDTHQMPNNIKVN